MNDLSFDSITKIFHDLVIEFSPLAMIEHGICLNEETYDLVRLHIRQ